MATPRDMVGVPLEGVDELAALDFGDAGELVGGARARLAVGGVVEARDHVAVDAGQVGEELAVGQVPDEDFAASAGVSAARSEALAVGAELEGGDAVGDGRGGDVSAESLFQFPRPRQIPQGILTFLGEEDETGGTEVETGGSAFGEFEGFEMFAIGGAPDVSELPVSRRDEGG